MGSFEVGAIINWDKYYQNPKTGKWENKLFVVMGAKQGKNIVLAITTSQRHHKICNPGCYTEDSYYMIDQKSSGGFIKDTWILLGELKELSPAKVLQLSLTEKDVQVVSKIPDNIFNGLVNCAKKAYDVPVHFHSLIGK